MDLTDERLRRLNDQIQREAALESFRQWHLGYEPGSAEKGPRSWRDMPLVWKWLGAEPVLSIYLTDGTYTQADKEALETLFPEATVHLPTSVGFGGMGGPLGLLPARACIAAFQPNVLESAVSANSAYWVATTDYGPSACRLLNKDSACALESDAYSHHEGKP